MRVIKPLYGIAEAGVHWWATYHRHHREQLKMRMSTFDPCLLVTEGPAESFGLVGMQTDDTLVLGTPAFSAREEKKIQKAKIVCKPKTTLTPTSPIDYNGTRLSLHEDGSLDVNQKGQAEKIAIIDRKSPDRAQRYLEQRARGAYIASICQPEATFDLSVAAQAQLPMDEDCTKLNKRLGWQIDNLARGLRYVPLDLTIAKLIVFVDGSFANNRDLSSQIGFVLALANEEPNGNSAQQKIRGNILHWSSTKCKRVTRSVLASEIYGMANGFDSAAVVSATLHIITDQLELPRVPLVVCTDSYSLYECLVKLGTTKEKRLMIDILALRQSYEKREISEIRWIHGDDNPADALTKSSPNKALERFVSTNELTVRIEGFVDRPHLASRDSQ
jgi:hypothetical protein